MTIKTKLNGVKRGNFQSEETRLQLFAEQMLVTRIFTASYVGRFYVEALKSYRDVVRIYEEEKDLMRDLEIVKDRIITFYQGALWPAITGPFDVESNTVPGCCIWVSLQDVPFGDYWFIVEHVNFSDHGEVDLGVKIIRKFEPENKRISEEDDVSPVNLGNISTSFNQWFQKVVTWHNIKESSKFFFALIMTIGTGLFFGVQYLGDYSIRFFREFNNFIKVLTPTFLAIIDMMSKVVGGFYLLIAMLWRGQGPVPQFPSLQSPPHRRAKPIYQPYYH